VPRLPGDTCTLSVEVDGHKKAYSGYFLYKIAASVTTLAGNGTNALVTTSLDKSQLRPVYIGADKDYNIFVTHENNTLLRLNEAENSITVVATSDQGFNHRCPVYTNPVTNVLQFGAEGGSNRDRFLFCDPKENWTPKLRFILEWDINGYSLPTNDTHYQCLYCEVDGYYYTRYNSGEIVRIDPKTWKATVVGITPTGITYGMVFHPFDKTVLWMGYDSGAGNVSHSICTFDVTDPESFTKLSGATNGGFRDGPLEISQFKNPRQVNFDADGNLYVGDASNQCIRMINTKTMMVETIIGIPERSGFKDGAKEDALFNAPHGIVIDADGIIYVSDYSNNRVRRIAIE
jgi:DNA-binding beta-propeller fold protein YncE